MNEKQRNYILAHIGLTFAIGGVIAYRLLPNYWYLLMWLPITCGYAVWFEFKK